MFLSEEEMAKLDEEGVADVVSRAGHIVIPGEDVCIGVNLIFGIVQAQAFI